MTRVSCFVLALLAWGRAAQAGSAQIHVSAVVLPATWYDTSPPRPPSVPEDAVHSFLWIDGELQDAWLVRAEDGTLVPLGQVWCVRTAPTEPESCHSPSSTQRILLPILAM